jgi:hypothetical protein
MRFHFLSSIFLISCLSISLWAAESRNRVEELFIWKISDELKLSVPEEKSFSTLVRDLNARRTAINDQLQNTVKKLGIPSSVKEKEKILVEHRKLLKSYSDLSVEEVDKIQKIFGVEKASQYFVLKNELTSKVKNLLASPEKQPAEKMAPPQVIEEK